MFAFRGKADIDVKDPHFCFWRDKRRCKAELLHCRAAPYVAPFTAVVDLHHCVQRLE
jgi:hypothetical protein